MKNILFFGILSVCFLIACSSTKSNIGSYLNKRETNAIDGKDKQFVDLVDGERVYGKQVDIGGTFKTIIIVDNVKYGLDKVKGVQLNNIYYSHIKNSLYQTLVRGGKINVYESSNTSYTNNRMTTTNNYYYSKNGGKLIALYSLKDIAEAIGDCKATESIKNLNKKSLKENTAKNYKFLNEYFEKYNSDCQ